MSQARDRVRCEHCGAANPRKHQKADRSLRWQYAVLCPPCGRGAGYWPISYGHLAGASAA